MCDVEIDLLLPLRHIDRWNAPCTGRVCRIGKKYRTCIKRQLLFKTKQLAVEWTIAVQPASMQIAKPEHSCVVHAARVVDIGIVQLHARAACHLACDGVCAVSIHKLCFPLGRWYDRHMCAIDTAYTHV